MFPEKPWWVQQHTIGTERHVKFNKAGKGASGFVDALVGATAIEYEKDLTKAPIFATGLGQVRDYCASMVNEGVPIDLIVGVLSDTVRWRAYRIATLLPMTTVPKATQYGGEHVVLEEIESVDLSAAGQLEASVLRDFLIRHSAVLARVVSVLTLSPRILALRVTFAKDISTALANWWHWHLKPTPSTRR